MSQRTRQEKKLAKVWERFAADHGLAAPEIEPETRLLPESMVAREVVGATFGSAGDYEMGWVARLLRGRIPGGLEADLTHLYRQGSLDGRTADEYCFAVHADLPEGEKLVARLQCQGRGMAWPKQEYKKREMFPAGADQLKVDEVKGLRGWLKKHFEVSVPRGELAGLQESLLTDEFTEWLLTTPDKNGFELYDGRFTAYRGQRGWPIEPEELLALCEGAAEFAERVRKAA